MSKLQNVLTSMLVAIAFIAIICFLASGIIRIEDSKENSHLESGKEYAHYFIIIETYQYTNDTVGLVYDKDTKIVYYAGRSGDITPYISENGNYCKYNIENKKIVELKEE